MSKNLLLYGYSGFNTDQRTRMEEIISELDDSVVVLMEDGTIGTRETGKKSPYSNLIQKNIKLYCQSEDFQARGNDLGSIIDGIKPINYDELIDLIETSERIISWL